MKTAFRVFAGVMSGAFAALLVLSVPARAQEEGDIIQFNNLIVQSVSGTAAPAEIVAVRQQAVEPQPCTRFESRDAKTGLRGLCPLPPGTPAASAEIRYRIAVDAETILMLRDRQTGTLADFSAGDRLNVFGFYREDGAIRGLVIRNLVKPLPKYFIQLNNVEVVKMSAQEPRTLFVVRRPELPCQKFESERKMEFPCPLGIPASEKEQAIQGISISDELKPIIGFSGTYEVRLTAKTILLDRDRKTIPFTAIAIGDRLNVYGTHTTADARIIEAEIVRDLSKPEKAPDAERFDGIITQINQGDGSFVLRLRDGTLVTVTNPVAIDSFVSVRGILDKIAKTIEKVSEIALRTKEEQDAIPVIVQLNPGAGPIGTRVTIRGSGFTPTGNDINFAQVPRAIANLASPDGKTLAFTVPATPCPPNAFCAQVVLQPGSYTVTVSNKNGVSNSAQFQVSELPPLGIITPALPQAVEKMKYSMMIEGHGGTDSYLWSVERGSLPPGLELIPGVCVIAPCRVPVTLAGIPAVPGSYTFALRLASGGETASKEFTLVVVQAISN